VAGVITLDFLPRVFLVVSISRLLLDSDAAAAATISSITDILEDNSIIFFLDLLGTLDMDMDTVTVR